MTISLKSDAGGASGTIQINGVDKVTVGANGITGTSLAVVAAPSMVRLNTANGYGSTATKIPRFTNVVTNSGSDITYTDSAANGASFTINTSGVYAITYSDNFSAGAWGGLSLNSASLTTNIQLLTVGETLSASITAAANAATVNSWVGYLAAGSVIRPHTEGTTRGTNAPSQQFTIVRVA